VRRIHGSGARALFALIGAVFVYPRAARAVDPFEIQVYDGTANAPLVPSLELHANSVIDGVRSAPAPEAPQHHQTHLTLEPALGVTRSLELGAYLQTALLADGSYDYAGTKLRAKLVSPPGHWEHLRLGANFELALLPRKFDRGRVGMELRPIVAWENEMFLFAFNPIVGVPLGPPVAHEGPGFEPAAMALYKWRELWSAGLEYYGDLGSFGSGFAPASQQAHYLFEVVNLLAVPRLELNLGVGEGLTHASNPFVIKLIAGFAFEPAPPPSTD
jgi:hypothetical protein